MGCPSDPKCQCRWPSHLVATSWLSWKDPHIIFPWIQATQSTSLESLVTHDKPSTRFFQIMSCNASFPGCASHLWSRLKDGVMERVAESSGEEGESAGAILRKYIFQILLSVSLLVDLLQHTNLMTL